MAETETESGLESSPRRKPTTRRVLSTQACDSCRNRKTRCEQIITRDKDLVSIGTEGRGTLDRSRSCKRCTRLGLECLYLLPVRSRGPQPRNKLEKAAKSPVSATSKTRNQRSCTSPISGQWLGSPVSFRSQVEISQSQEVQVPATTFSVPGLPLSNQLWSVSPQSTGLHEQLEPTTYPTDIICGRKMLEGILNDYFESLYPLVPIVHRPSFLHDFSSHQNLYDRDHLSLICALCAITVAAMPGRFSKYQRLEETPRYASPKAMIYACYNTTQQLRGQDYFDAINYQKWAVSHLMFLSFFHITEYNRARMIEVEAMQLARLLDLHKVSGYEGLNCIEKQLRKKGFWLTFYGYVHGQLQFLRKERLTFVDHIELQQIQFEAMMPDEVDDEYILENAVLPQPRGKLSLVVGFNLNSRLFQAALTSTMLRHAQNSSELCYCSRTEDQSRQMQQIKEGLCKLKYMLDNIPVEMRSWAAFEDMESGAPGSEYKEKRMFYGQFASMRANLHTTHLWFQSLLLDQLAAHVEAQIARGSALPLSLESEYNSNFAWSEREDLCRQLLHLLHGIPEIYLEPNGHIIVSKVRDVAVSLLMCPTDLDEGVHRRAAAYLEEFSVILSKLDGSDRIDTLHLQTWVDTDRRYRL